jgi:hypothetical protein
VRTALRAQLDADLDTATRAFKGRTADRRIWATIAWRVGVGEFHHALLDKLSEDSSDNAVSGDCAGIFPEAEGRATQWSIEG